MSAHQRKKQPERVRQQLLGVAAKLTLDRGLANVTLDAVAQAAGVSKGGLLHHFPSKMALFDGLFLELTERLDAAISEEMRNDPIAKGRFTRGYLRAVLALDRGADGQGWHVLTIALMAEPSQRARWRRWVEDKADAYVGTDSSVDCLLARLAADGLWLADVLASHAIDDATRHALFQRLTALSLQ